MKDLDLGARLGFARPRKFRELVERLRRDHLTERGALIAITKSDWK